MQRVTGCAAPCQRGGIDVGRTFGELLAAHRMASAGRRHAQALLVRASDGRAQRLEIGGANDFPDVRRIQPGMHIVQHDAHSDRFRFIES
jgi:hypothetical protein